MQDHLWWSVRWVHTTPTTSAARQPTWKITFKLGTHVRINSRMQRALPPCPFKKKRGRKRKRHFNSVSTPLNATPHSRLHTRQKHLVLSEHSWGQLADINWHNQETLLGCGSFLVKLRDVLGKQPRLLACFIDMFQLNHLSLSTQDKEDQICKC